YGTAMRIGTNHGSLSDRIMSRYGDTPMGMVESAMEFLRIARAESYHNIVLSMKSSNPQVMVQAYRLLIKTMEEEFNECYPLHLGVTEAGDGEDGRIKSAIGIGTLLEDGIGDTIRVSLTEDPELEVPVCKDIVKHYSVNGQRSTVNGTSSAVIPPIDKLPYSPFEYKRRESFAVDNIGGAQVPVVIADLSKMDTIDPVDLQQIGYHYDEPTDKWTIADIAADYIFTGNTLLRFALPGTLKVIVYPGAWEQGLATSAGFGEEALVSFKEKYYPIYDDAGYVTAPAKSQHLNFVMVDCFGDNTTVNDFTHLDALANDPTVVLCLSSQHPQPMIAVRRMCVELMNRSIKNPVVLIVDSAWQTADEHLIHYATEAGALLLDGIGDGVCFGMTAASYKQSSVNTGPSKVNASGRNYIKSTSVEAFINNTAFSILQATRTRISKTEYIS
ncbi:MAG: 1-hydroxy-2-methyl-2-(E)-butenyl 4-diphosphate synthase, partial [Sphingobacteriales bacterium]